MILSNMDTEINISVVNFKANGVEFKYVQSIEDTERYVKIKYPFDHLGFKKGKTYDITYETERLKVNMVEHGKCDSENKTFSCGRCRLNAVERVVELDGVGSIMYVFKKVKSK